MEEIKRGCSEVSYILEHLAPNDKTKIPQSVIRFFRENSDITYQVNLDVSKPLQEQKLRDETKAFLQILTSNYLTKPTSKDEVQVINQPKTMNEFSHNQEKVEPVKEELITYQENKFKKIINMIISKIKRK